MALTLILSLVSVIYLFQAWHLSVGTMTNPGPGAYPIGLGLFMLFCLALQFFKDFRTKGGKTARLPFRWQLAMGVASLGYALVLERVGYLASTVLYATVMALIFGCTDSDEGCNWKALLSARSIGLALATGIAITALGYLLFHVLFNFRLP